MKSLSPTDMFAPCPAPFNLAAHVLRHADDLGDKIALSLLGPDGSEDWTYARLAAAVPAIMRSV